MTEMTVEEVIQATVDLLTGIRVPAEESEEIGVPVCHALRNLRAVQEAMEKGKKEQEQANAPALTEAEI